MILFLSFVCLCAPLQETDVPLEKARLASFVKSGGASELGNDVRWRVPATAFTTARKTKKGYSAFVHRGIGLVIASEAASLAEVKRRGGTALLRGKVVRVPMKGRGKGDPEFAIEIRELGRRP